MKKDKLLIKTRILREIFEIAPKRYQEKNLDNHPLSKKLNISEKELKNNIEFLIEMGLIRRWIINENGDRIYEWVLTENGLDYLEKKSGEKKQEEFNKIVAFTGSIIALTAIYSFLIEAINLKDSPSAYAALSYIFITLIIISLGPLVGFIINFLTKEILNR